MSQSPSLTEYALAGAAIISAVGTLIGILVQAKTGTKQLQATVVSSSREAWINALRDDVAEAISLVEGYHRVPANGIMADENAVNDRARADYRRRAEFALTRIRLRVNETEQEAKDLVGFLQTAIQTMKMEGPLREAITSAAQRILKAEWQRVKRLE
jgi:hypothetical protein